MKYRFDLHKDSEEYRIVTEISRDLGIVQADDGEEIRVARCETGLLVEKDERGYQISYSTLSSFTRALGLLVENGCFPKREIPKYEMLCIQLDNSRNAVLKPESICDWIRKAALMGYNAMMLYTEDTYEVQEQPYFGHLRGRFTESEMKKIDDYASIFGIEIIPCIQTLAHLKSIFRWQAYQDCNDIDDILLMDCEKSLQLIENMIATMARCFRSRRINLGMDEAHLLGRGRYLDEHGFVPRTELMRKQLQTVCDICKKYGYSPMMWSDMFYGLVENKLTADDVDRTALPEGVFPIAWNYWSMDNREYDEIFRCHKLFGRPFAFAAGASTWFGLVPLSEYALNVARSVLVSIDRAELKHIIVTAWGDDGATCSLYFALPTMLMFAENCWSGSVSEDHLAKRFDTCFEGNFRDFVQAERINDVPGRTNYGAFFSAPNRYMLYNDVLTGLYDRHVLPGTSLHFAKQKQRMAECSERNPAYAYLFDTLEALCNLLEKKAELGKAIKKAYDEGDRNTLRSIMKKDLPAVADAAELLSGKMSAQWLKENKTAGLEVTAIRIGGIAERARQAIYLLGEYTDGRLAKIEDLEAPRLPIDGTAREDDYVFEGRMLWNRMVSVNVQCIYI